MRKPSTSVERISVSNSSAPVVCTEFVVIGHEGCSPFLLENVLKIQTLFGATAILAFAPAAGASPILG
jgi:hypothetical protein